MNNLIEFNSQNLKLINHKNQLWFTSTDIAKALSYSDSNAITLLYSKHKSEFDNEMSQTIETIGSGNLMRRQRIFNREGAWLIGMFARTPKAAEFRKWVLKVLGAVTDSSPAVQNDAKGEVAVKEHTRSLPSGKKEIVLSDKAKSEIGGIVKAIVQAELMKVFAGSGLEVNPSGMPFANWAVSAVHAVGAMQSEYQALKQKQQQAVRLLENKAD